MTSDQPLLVDWPEDGVLRLALNRPARRNAVDDQLLAQLHSALDQGQARVVVLCSSTPGAFCAGVDLTLDGAVRAEVSNGLYGLYRRMVSLPAPLVAVLEGPAVGGGAQLAIACDVRVAQPTSWLRFVGPGHGLVVGAWGLPSLVGRGRALDLCLSGRRVGASAALQMGLVDRVSRDAASEALALAIGFASLDAAAVARTKMIIGGASSLLAGLEEETQANLGWDGHAARAAPSDGRDRDA